MKYTESITDRAASDIVAKTSKAYFNLVDWVRIYGNAQFVDTLVTALTGAANGITTISEPTITSFPMAADFNALLNDLMGIRDSINSPDIAELDDLKTDWRTGSIAQSPTYLTVNQWEKFIDALIMAVVGFVDYRVYCGVSTSGQMRFYQNRFRRFAWVADSPSPVRRARVGVAASNSGLTRNNGFRSY